MKILIATTLFYPAKLGGPANTLYWLSKALVKTGVNVSVVTTNRQIEPGKNKVDKWSDVDGINVRYCKADSFCFLKMLYHTWKEMKSCDTVMLCDMFQPQVLPVAFMARLRKKKIIWSPRGELHGPALAGRWVKLWYIGVVRNCFGNYATFHATSEEERDLIHEHIGKNAKVVVIPNYMELPPIQERKQLAIPYLLFVGRRNRIKALDRLILGLAKSKLFKQKDYILKIAGPNQDDYQQELEKMIDNNDLKEKVEFVGNVFCKDKSQLYANAHFSCLLSHSENFGNVVIEALSQGTPVIASTGTPWQELNSCNAGFWIENTPERIAACVDNILEMSDAQYEEMRHNARELANTYDVFQNVDKWVKAI